MFQINKNYKLEKLVTKPRDARPMLENINFQDFKGKPSAVSTNGRACAVVPAEGDTSKPRALPVKALQYKRSLAPKDKAAIEENDLVPEKDQLNYPGVTQIFPDYGNQETITVGIDPLLLKDLFEAMGGKKGKYIYLTIANDGGQCLSPIEARISNDDEATGVIMPVRA